jgi:peptidoglycan/xylan/chitin deacetylase (PgdA/CDA1 family)
MTVVRAVKRAVLSASRGLGLMDAVRGSDWRRRRLMILCYHGVSLADEHEWSPTLYMRRETLEARLATLKRLHYPVVPLDAGLRAMREGTLPQGAVAITFDDGMYDFHEAAFPLLARYAMPATVYQATLYTDEDRPVFNVVVAYLLWKGRHRRVSLGEFVPDAEDVALVRAEDRARVGDRLEAWVEDAGLDLAAKDAVAERLAAHLDIDYAAIRRRRLLQAMRASEVRELADRGIAFELHTHNHVTPNERTLFIGEVTENRERLTDVTGRQPSHFCYPSGVYRREWAEWLDHAGVVSATTCDPGLANPGDSPLFLPRFVDNENVSPVEFEAWLSGVALFLPRRTRHAHPGRGS